MKMCWLSFKEIGSHGKERGRTASRDPGELEKNSLFLMNINLPKRVEMNITNNRGPTPILFYFPIMTRTGVGKLFISGPESKDFRPGGSRGQIEAIICFYITIKNMKTSLSSRVGKKQEDG